MQSPNRKTLTFLVLLWSLVLVPHASAARATEPDKSSRTLIPRRILFGNATRQSLTISPDGTRIGWLQPSASGIMNVWTCTFGHNDARMLTDEKQRGIGSYWWSGDGSRVLYALDQNADAIFHIYAADVQGGTVRDLTPFRGVRAQNVIVRASRPNEILVGMNLRTRDRFDVYRINLETGAVALDTENPGDVISWTADDDLQIRALTAFDPQSGRSVVRTRPASDKPWHDVVQWEFNHTPARGQSTGGSMIAGLIRNGTAMIVTAPIDASRQADVWVADTNTGERIATILTSTEEEVATDPGTPTDPGTLAPMILRSTVTGEVQAIALERVLPTWHFRDKEIQADFDVLSKEIGGFVDVVSRDNRDSVWIVRGVFDHRPSKYYVYERESKSAYEIFDAQPAFDDYAPSETTGLTIRNRSGLPLVCYLTMPAGGQDRKLPMIVMPHAWLARERSRYDPIVQWLASRGYAVLRVNQRGSTGLGLDFWNLGDGQLGTGMEMDIKDAVDWVVAKGIADPHRLGIVGIRAMGGYMAVRATVMYPDMYAAAAALNVLPDLGETSANLPAFWAVFRMGWNRRICDCDHDDKMNREFSPIFGVDRIKTPLFLAQTKNHLIARAEITEKFVAALEERKRTVTYVLYPDEGTFVNRPENALDFYGRLEEFLAKRLGGNVEPWEQVEGTTAQLRPAVSVAPGATH